MIYKVLEKSSLKNTDAVAPPHPVQAKVYKVALVTRIFPFSV